MTDLAPGTPVWVDLATPDAPASLAFYGELFGWTATEPDEGLGGYQNFLLDGRRVAGMSPMGGPIWMTHISAASADDAAALVTANGGKVLYEPMDVAELGRLAICEDPQGAPFGVWQPGLHRGAEAVNVAGALTWNEIHTTDVPGACAFYAAVFGWTPETVPMEGHDYVLFKLGERAIGGAGEVSDTPHWLAWFAVADADASAARATELGGSVHFGPFDVPGVGRTAILDDPHGARFGILRGETPDE